MWLNLAWVGHEGASGKISNKTVDDTQFSSSIPYNCTVIRVPGYMMASWSGEEPLLRLWDTSGDPFGSAPATTFDVEVFIFRTLLRRRMSHEVVKRT
jgi:hypothetical protein